jgi:hypothetical protein
MAPEVLVRLNGDFGTSRFKGNCILRHLTRLRNRWLRPKARLAYRSEAATAAPKKCPDLARLRHADER